MHFFNIGDVVYLIWGNRPQKGRVNIRGVRNGHMSYNITMLNSGFTTTIYRQDDFLLSRSKRELAGRMRKIMKEFLKA